MIEYQVRELGHWNAKDKFGDVVFRGIKTKRDAFKMRQQADSSCHGRVIVVKVTIEKVTK